MMGQISDLFIWLRVACGTCGSRVADSWLSHVPSHRARGSSCCTGGCHLEIQAVAATAAATAAAAVVAATITTTMTRPTAMSLATVSLWTYILTWSKCDACCSSNKHKELLTFPTNKDHERWREREGGERERERERSEERGEQQHVCGTCLPFLASSLFAPKPETGNKLVYFRSTKT